jgi:1,4-dihydroxy-2-naphthoate octaprenyltransferase
MNGISKILTPWMLAARPKTLPAAIGPVLVGSALAQHYQSFSWPIFLACGGLSLLLQIGANFANDLFDFLKGADSTGRIGPQRAVASGWITVHQMQTALILVLTAALILGGWLATIGGPLFFLIGIFCVAAAILYTAGPFALAYKGLGDIAVFIFFGLIAVGGTFFLHSRELTLEALVAGTGVGAMITNILVVNNMRDRHHDALSGKRTLAVRFGRGFCVNQYIFLLGIGYLCIVILAGVSPWALLTFLTLPFAVKRAREMIRLEGQELNNTLANTAKLVLAYSILLAAGLII